MQDPNPHVNRPTEDSFAWLACREHWLDLSRGAVIMGILNVTPDSFYDGGRYLNTSEALKRAEAMLIEGARIIDVGGASSRPRGSIYGEGAGAVSSECEIDRVVPVIKAIRRSFPEAIVSVDTFSPVVTSSVLDAGAHMINDISGLQNGVASAEYAGEAGAAYVLMHSIRQQGGIVHAAEYSNVVTAVYTSLKESIERASDAGIHSIIVDPGFGFGKLPSDNLRLVNHLDLFAELGYPIVIGISRKSTVGQVLSKDSVPIPVEDRLFGSLGVTAVAVLRGAKIIRTHDVRGTLEMIQGMEAVLNVPA